MGLDGKEKGASEEGMLRTVALTTAWMLVPFRGNGNSRTVLSNEGR